MVPATLHNLSFCINTIMILSLKFKIIQETAGWVMVIMGSSETGQFKHGSGLLELQNSFFFLLFFIILLKKISFLINQLNTYK